MPHPPPPCYLREHAPEDAPTDADVAAAQLQLTGLRAGMEALDAGCGNGTVTRVMSTIVGPSRVTGVDSNLTRLAAARGLASALGIEIEFLEGAATRLPLPAASFDYTWSRFLLAEMPQPARALAELVRVTRSGGRVVVGELAGPLAPFQPLAPALPGELREALRLLGRGGDRWMGRTLYGWCAQAGLREITVHALPYQVGTGGVSAGALETWRTKLATDIPRLVTHTGERARWEQLRDGLLAELQRPDLIYCSTLILVRGTVPDTRGPQARAEKRSTP